MLPWLCKPEVAAPHRQNMTCLSIFFIHTVCLKRPHCNLEAAGQLERIKGLFNLLYFKVLNFNFCALWARLQKTFGIFKIHWRCISVLTISLLSECLLPSSLFLCLSLPLSALNNSFIYTASEVTTSWKQILSHYIRISVHVIALATWLQSYCITSVFLQLDEGDLKISLWSLQTRTYKQIFTPLENTVIKIAVFCVTRVEMLCMARVDVNKL